MRAIAITVVLCLILVTSVEATGAGALGAFPGDRGLIAFGRGDDQIYTIAEDGSDLTQITSEGVNKSPAWSPDGNRLA